jgi:hypothetical protein|tara:strand:+ start:81 stop:404 length:324 start_codon:yes stop_codon:yes gene_type:complete
MENTTELLNLEGLKKMIGVNTAIEFYYLSDGMATFKTATSCYPYGNDEDFDLVDYEIVYLIETGLPTFFAKDTLVGTYTDQYKIIEAFETKWVSNTAATRKLIYQNF